MQDTIDSICTKAITEKEWQHIKRDADTNLPKHFKNGRFGEESFGNIVPSKFIRKIALIIAFSVKKNNHDQEYMKQLLMIIFEKLKCHPNNYIKQDARRAMCDIHKYTKLYLTTNFHPETYSKFQQIFQQ